MRYKILYFTFRKLLVFHFEKLFRIKIIIKKSFIELKFLVTELLVIGHKEDKALIENLQVNWM